MTLRKRLFFCFLTLCQLICAQEKPVELNEVTISDTRLNDFSASKSVSVLNDSVIRKNQPSLTSLLNYNSVVYFKENGLGMVSSPAFRGTTAQQTAVVWNGININSQFLGQTDFNTITTSDFSAVTIRAGGGSGLYGSSAIGGTIHLNNDMRFGKGFSNSFQARYGSFSSTGLHYGIKYSGEKLSSQFSISRNSSDNDYKYVNSKFRNRNGQFYNTSYNLGFGYKFNLNNFIKLYSQVYDGKRHFSLISPSDTKTMYTDFNTRTLAEWTSFFSRFISKAKVAVLTEKYQYYGDIASDNYTFGKATTFIAKYDLAHRISEKATLDYSLDYTKTQGNGSDISTQSREIASASLLFKHRPSDSFTYDVVVRKEATSNYKSPLLFSLGSSYAFSKIYRLKANVSTNFRIPSFNDLYWQGAGNKDLKPESSRQVELGNEFTFSNLKITANLYATEIDEMIRWVPGSGGLFMPENVDEVTVMGAEILLNAHKKIGRNRFELNATYAYTNSQNEATGKQLIYVPFHKATASAGYSAGKFGANLQYLFVGKVFTQSDNNPIKRVPLYHIASLGFDYDFGKNDVYELGCSIQNLGNVNYRAVEGRYMPGRYYTVFFNLKF